MPCKIYSINLTPISSNATRKVAYSQPFRVNSPHMNITKNQLDLDSLLELTRSQSSRQYIEEAIAAYKAMSYRGAIVQTWVAVVFDIFDKSRELAIGGSPAAIAFISELNAIQSRIQTGEIAAIKQALEIEQNILAFAKEKLEIINDIQMRELERIKEDRNKCAHPSFLKINIPYQPGPELARCHIATACRHLLSEPPIQGKFAISQALATVRGAFFPGSLGKAQSALSIHDLPNASEPMLRGIIDEIVFNDVEKKTPQTDPLKCGLALHSLVLARYDACKDRVKFQMSKAICNANDECLPRVIRTYSTLHPDCALISDPAIAKISTFVDIADLGAICAALPGLLAMQQISGLIPRIIERVPIVNLAKAMAPTLPNAVAKDIGVNQCISSRSWDVTNAVIDGILKPCMPLLTKADVNAIVCGPRTSSSDLIGANEYRGFLSQVVEHGIMNREELCELLRAESQTKYADFLVDPTA